MDTQKMEARTWEMVRAMIPLTPPMSRSLPIGEAIAQAANYEGPLDPAALSGAMQESYPGYYYPPILNVNQLQGPPTVSQ